MRFAPNDIPDINNPDRDRCEVVGCLRLQRNHGHKVWGRLCDKHHADPQLKLERADSRLKAKQARLDAKETAKRIKKEERQAIQLLPKLCTNCGVNMAIKKQSTCKPCLSKLGRDRRRQKVYGLTIAGYEALKASQNDCCAICGEKVELCIDHCHSASRVRGLLCSKCNVGLGMFKDDLDLLASASSYLVNSRLKKIG